MGDKRTYNVLDYYEETGAFQAIARSNGFKTAMTTCTVMWSVWMSVDIDHNAAASIAEAAPVFMIATVAFLLIFIFDITVRLLAFKRKVFAFKDGPWVRDLFLTIAFLSYVIIGLAQSEGLRIMGVLWLLQAFRLCRLAGAMPELAVLCKGMWVATRSVFFLICLQLMVTYVFGMAFARWVDDSESLHEHFHSVPQSMYTLITYGFVFNIAQISDGLKEQNFGLVVLFWLYCLVSFCNIVMGAGCICEIVSTIASVEKEELTVKWLEGNMGNRFRTDEGEEGLSKDQCREMLKSPEMEGTAQMIGVKTEEVLAMVDVIYGSNERVPFSDLMKAMLSFAPGNNAAVKDVMGLKKDMHEYAQKTGSPSLQDIQKVVTESVAPLREKLEAIEKLMKQQGNPGTNMPGVLSDL